MDYITSGSPVLHHFLDHAQIHVYWISDAIQPSHSLLFPCPPTFSLSDHQGLFKWVNSSFSWPKNWSFSFSISPSNEYSGLISFRMDWLELLAAQGTLKSLLQHHSSKASVLQIRWPKYGVSASVSVLPMNIQDWFPLGLTDWISLQSKGLSGAFLSTTV